MNKLFYRLIFNTARQMVMVVADITRSHRAALPVQVKTVLRKPQITAYVGQSSRLSLPYG
ncbi:ESPR-type extended signal peptide-containing protein [Providencia huaxiensis]